jgi:MFS family permease
VIGDLFRAEDRGKAVAIYNMAPILGPTLGPVIGAAVTQFLSWRWIFYIMSIIDLVVLASSFLLLRETYVPVLEKRQQREEPEETSAKPSMRQKLVSFLVVLGGNLQRPLQMLFKQHLIQLLAIYVAYLYGVMYLVLSTFQTLWVGKYQESIFIGGLNYIALGLGYVVGSQVCAFSMDKIYRRLKHHNGEVGLPEFRLPLALVSTILVPAGLIIYAWSVHYRTLWIIPDLGAAIFSAGVIIGMQCITNYVIDAYPRYIASAIGAVTLLRGLAGFGFPLFAPYVTVPARNIDSEAYIFRYMYARLDYGWGNTLLAFIAIAVGIAAPVALWFFGAKMRNSVAK